MKHHWTIHSSTYPLIGQPGTERNIIISVDSNIDLKLDSMDAHEIVRSALINTDYVCREAVVTKDS